MLILVCVDEHFNNLYQITGEKFMIALQIKDTKNFMTKLLSGEAFDSFLLEEAEIRTFNTFVIDGHQNREFYTKEELEDPEVFAYEYSRWKDVKGLCFQMIKGKKVPAFMKFTLLLMPEAAYNLLEKEDVIHFADTLKALVLTIKYDGNGLMLTTGTSFSTFVMDKSLDTLWDISMRKFLTGKDIHFEEV